jgi:hypothetical protein
MNATPFDTLKMARKLEAAGFPGPRAAGAAEAMAEAMSGAELATKTDLQRETGHLRTGMTAMETRLSTAIVRAAGGIGISRRDMPVRFCIIMTVSTGVVLSAMRFMLTHP